MTGTMTGSDEVEVRAVPTRRVSFEESLRTLTKHYAADEDLILSHMFAALSAVFPDGEDFFVRSVRHFRDQITDPVLQRQVAGFIGQESVHGREHRAFNRRLAQLGYPTLRVERITRWGLKNRERVFTPTANLAATAALEHFTATLAELALTDEVARTLPGDPNVRDLFLWHALEESEHKAVAFDVYRAVGGGYWRRTTTMLYTTAIFFAVLALVQARMMVTRRVLWKPWTWTRGVRKMWLYPAYFTRLVPAYLDYFRPRFHPDDRDTDALLARWRETLFGADGALNDRAAA